MASKRLAEEAVGGTPVAKKPKRIFMAPLDIGPVGGEDELDIEVLQIQNRKLSERLRERNRGRELLEERVAKLEEEQDGSLRLQAILNQGFVALRECVAVAMTAADSEVDVLSEDDVCESVKEVEGVAKVFRIVCGNIEALAKIKTSVVLATDDFEGQEEQDETAHGKKSRALSLLKEVARQHKKRLQEETSVELWEAKCDKSQKQVADLRFLLERSQVRADKLEERLESCLAQIQTGSTLPQATATPSVASSATSMQKPLNDEVGCTVKEEGLEGRSVPTTSSPTDTDAMPMIVTATPGGQREGKDEMESLMTQLAEANELGKNRLEQMEILSTQLAQVKKELGDLKLSQHTLPESLVKQSSLYRSLQTQFSIAIQESSQLRVILEEAKGLLVLSRQQYFAQLEEIRGEEVKYQMEVREEMGTLEGALAAGKHEYEILRIEYERMVASNEQAGPIAKELRVTVDSLQKSIVQHKSEIGRYKSRAHKAEQQLAKLQEEEERAGSVAKERSLDPPKEESSECSGDKGGGDVEEEDIKAKLKLVELELESYRQNALPQEREVAEIVSAEKKARNQVEELKKKFEDYRRDYEKRKEHIKEEAYKKARSLTEDNRHLQKDLSAKKHEAQALVTEMENTAQAFEEMQDQNLRLLQQLKEKDDANFKLMSERIKSNSIHKLLMEEKELLQNQLNAIAVERQRYAELVSGLEERECATEATLQSVDKELALQQQASEAHRKKAQESVQEVAEKYLQLEEQQKQITLIQKDLSSRTDEWEVESQQHRRSMEEVGSLKRKLEKYKSREWMVAGDEVLLEEIKTYKAKLHCPCCSARKKDTVLTKCFHVFCSECIRNRYDSRLRKCPKCGAPFGANDFHKIYLS